MKKLLNYLNGLENCNNTFSYCTKLTTITNIPSSVYNLSGVFYDCASLTGDVEINSTRMDYWTDCFKGAATNSGCDLKLTGTASSTILNNLLNTKSEESHISLKTNMQGGEINVTSVTLNKHALNLTVGSNETLAATISPTNATNKNVTWSSNNGSVASVNSAGKVTAISAGTARITATSEDGSLTDNCMVTVTAAPSSNITFYINFFGSVLEYHCQSSMTWAQFCSTSEGSNFYVENGYIFAAMPGGFVLNPHNDDCVLASSVISNGTTYGFNYD